MKRTLYDCYNARVVGPQLACSRGHQFSVGGAKGTIPAHKLEYGSPLAIRECQGCPDFDQMDGGKVTERGWK
ncbi:hypothetical protein LCGC14_2666550 [marine sediment metagenome]|uniref:Uncharacterized protein n=1 Tax=marine sediment metagenome TaxID=412755 RepID=A0A0F9CH91_9ZZZZ